MSAQDQKRAPPPYHFRAYAAHEFSDYGRCGASYGEQAGRQLGRSNIDQPWWTSSGQSAKTAAALDLSVRPIYEAADSSQSTEEENLKSMFKHLQLGKNYLYGNLPMFIIGTLVKKRLGYMVFENTSWVDSLGSFDEAIRTGNVSSSQAIGAAGGKLLIGTSGFLAAALWTKDLPRPDVHQVQVAEESDLGGGMFEDLKIGKNYLYGNLPMFIIGTLVDKDIGNLVFQNTSWIDSLGSFDDALRTGRVSSSQLIGSPKGEFVIGTGGFLAAADWDKPLPGAA